MMMTGLGGRGISVRPVCRLETLCFVICLLSALSLLAQASFHKTLMCNGCFNGGKMYVPKDPFSNCRCRCQMGYAGSRCQYQTRRSIRFLANRLHRSHWKEPPAPVHNGTALEHNRYEKPASASLWKVAFADKKHILIKTLYDSISEKLEEISERVEEEGQGFNRPTAPQTPTNVQEKHYRASPWETTEEFTLKFPKVGNNKDNQRIFNDEPIRRRQTNGHFLSEKIQSNTKDQQHIKAYQAPEVVF